MPKSPTASLPEFRLTSVTTSPFEPRRRSATFEEDDALRRVRQHLERNISRHVTLAESAAVAGFERTYFSSYFHKKVGITYVRWMNAVRIAHAIEILRVSTELIGEIGKRVGYSDLRTFERNFRRLTGQTPTLFRDQSQRRSANQAEVSLDKEHFEAMHSGPPVPEGSIEPVSAEQIDGWFGPDSWIIPSS